MTWRIYQFIHHLFYIRHRRGHGIHSPYLFEFVSEVLFNSGKVECPAPVKSEHRKLRRENAFARHSSVSGKYGFLLYRIARWFRPEMIIELGTGMGISSLYLSAGSPDTPLHSIEGNRDRAALAAQMICRLNPGPVSIHWGEMEEKLEDILPMIPQRFLAFVDGNHHYTPTIHYLARLMERAGDEVVIVIDDIYWSRDMNRAWKEVISWPEVRESIDLFQMGILFLRKEIQKRGIKIMF